MVLLDLDEREHLLATAQILLPAALHVL